MFCAGLSITPISLLRVGLTLARQTVAGASCGCGRGLTPAPLIHTLDGGPTPGEFRSPKYRNTSEFPGNRGNTRTIRGSAILFNWLGDFIWDWPTGLCRERYRHKRKSERWPRWGMDPNAQRSRLFLVPHNVVSILLTARVGNTQRIHRVDMRRFCFREGIIGQ